MLDPGFRRDDGKAKVSRCTSQEEAALGRVEVLGGLGDNGEGSTARFTEPTALSASAKDICRLAK